MASQSKKSTDTQKVEEGYVARSPNEWAKQVLESQSIATKDPQKNNKLWDFGIKEHVFSSGSDLTKEDYLRLRVLWNTWTDQRSLGSYMRDNTALVNDKQQSTLYTGYISPENDEIANAIYTAIKPRLHGYLQDIRRVGKGDATRPSAECGIFYMTRYWQGLVSMILKEVYDDNDRRRHFRGKVRKSEAGLPQLAAPSKPPQTPTKQRQPRQPQEGFGTPAFDAARASAGGLQNPATADETYVNTALLLFLQTITRLVTDLEETYRTPSNASGKSTSAGSSGPPSTTNSRPASRAVSQDRTSESGSRANSRSGSVDRITRELDRRPSSQPSTRTSSTTSTNRRSDDTEAGQSPLAMALSQVRGLRYLDWLADRLPLSLMDRSSRAPGAASAKKLMEARVDGYLCRRDFVQGSGNDGRFHPRFNKYPLAILEAKPFTRLSALSAIRWQESAELASWVSGLDDAYEHVGLLQSSTSGRKRRLLISQDRHELWIIIAEYGDKWKHYIRGHKLTRPTDFNQSQDVKDLSGSEGFVSLSQHVARDRYDEMMRQAQESKKEQGSTRTSRGPSLELPGPEYFCIMHQWGPYKTESADHMDFFIRRLIGLQIQLSKNWPGNRFQHPYPR